jgi:hypothetical protein
MVAAQRILQIIPAVGWLAVYDFGSSDVEDIRTRPLACFALVEDQTGTRVIGMDADAVASHPTRGRFLGYIREGENLQRFRKS